jgi:hypothetical protein
MGKRKYWSEEDTAYLRDAYTSGVSTAEIKKRLNNKTFAEIYARISYLQLSKRGRGSNQSSKIKWTDADIQFIKENFHTMTNPAMAKALNKKISVFRAKCRELNLLHMEMEYWTTEQVDYLKANYRTKGDQQIADEFQDQWPKKKGWTKKHIDKKRGYLGLQRTTEEQFLIRTGRFNAEDYKDFNGKNFPEGKLRMWHQNGKFRWMIKVGKKFIAYHRYVWEQAHGPIPNDKKLYFLDGDTTNYDLSNLALMSKAELAKAVSTKVHAELSDSYLAGILSRDKEAKRVILQHPELLAAKRSAILLNRKLGLSRCKTNKSSN